MLYLLIENEKLVSVCDYEPNIGDDDIKIVKYDGKIPADRVIYINGKIKDSDNYLLINDQYVPKTGTLEKQINTNSEARKYLKNTDWLVIRHRDQADLGLETSLTEDEYKEILEKRQEAREKVVDYNG